MPVPVAGVADLEALPSPDVVINLHWLVDRTLDEARQQSYEMERNISELEYVWQWICTAGQARFLNVSSVSVFGLVDESPISARTEPQPSTPYGRAKLAAEQYFEALFAESTVHLSHARLGPVWASCEHPSRLMSGLYQSAFHGATVSINRGHATCGLYVDEAVDLLITTAAAAPPGCFLLTGPPVANEETARVFEEVAGRPLTVDFVDLAPGVPDPVYVSDVDRFSTDWTRHVDLREATRLIISERTPPCDGAGS
jgi:nucleoside-diphosphate-sugar epimerase